MKIPTRKGELMSKGRTHVHSCPYNEKREFFTRVCVQEEAFEQPCYRITC